MKRPGFSVVTPSYDQAAYIRDNIESVLAQDYPHVEHIVIDNASTDGTTEILREYPSVIWRSEADAGQSDAVNKAIQSSSNDWIIWVNSDDYLLPGALKLLAAYIENQPKARVLMSNHVRVTSDGAVTRRITPVYSHWKLRHWWWAALQLWQPGLIFHRTAFDSAGPLNTRLHYAMDFDFFLRLQDSFAFHYLDADLVAFRVHDEQKGHASELPFIEERLSSTKSYWRQRGRTRDIYYRALLYFVEGSLVFVEGLRQLDNGNRDVGKKLIRRGLRRNPFALLRPEHVGFWLRKTRARCRIGTAARRR